MATRRSRAQPALVGGLALLVALSMPALVHAPGAAPAVLTGAAAATDPIPGYPRQVSLTPPPVDTGDASLRPGLTAYHDIAPRLNAAQVLSDRVSVEVIGASHGGRELHLVTLTAPETSAQATQQQHWRDAILLDPAAAAEDEALAQGYKVPVFVSANIHGNEWEGTDAALRLIEEVAASEDPEVAALLDTMRISLVVSMNPDGRVAGIRANTAGFDLNRDLITATQPEVLAVREALIATQPVLMLDLHGYVNGTLVEPTTPPHGENYEYDLFISHAYPNGLGVEQAILDLGHTFEADGVHPPQIPFRDWDEGWDDWPPIFTPQYAAYHGAASHTIEFPLRINGSDYQLPVPELTRRSAINTDIAHAAVLSTIGYAAEHREALIADQIEIFRRGVAGEEQRPVTDDLFPEIGPEDVYTTDFPRAYLIPVGAGQRSDVAAARLVDHLIANGVQVARSTRPITTGGTTYPPGTYVVDLHQGKRGIANTILAAGSDISDRVEAMYDISGWSHGLLWGADVGVFPAQQRLPGGNIPVTGAEHTGRLDGDGGWTLRLDDPADLAALNSLLAAGVTVRVLDDASVLVPADAAAHAQRVADDFGVVLTEAGPTARGRELDGLSVAAAATPGELWALDEMGFAVTEVNPAILNDGFDWSEIDALFVSAGLSWGSLEPQARAGLQGFIADGGGYVGRGTVGAGLNEALGLLEATARSGRGDGNGVVAVDNAAGPIASRAPEHTFVYSPVWFTDLGGQVRIDQWYAADPLVSGHWLPLTNGSGGPDDAAGQALVVSGLGPAGTGAVLLGSEPMFRAHPKGQYPLVGRALVWAGVQR